MSAAPKPPATRSRPVEIEGVRYYTAAALCEEVDIARGTLWRWRTEGKVPAGRKYRGQQLLFTEGEAQQIRSYAQRLEPAPPATKSRRR